MYNKEDLSEINLPTRILSVYVAVCFYRQRFWTRQNENNLNLDFILIQKTN